MYRLIWGVIVLGVAMGSAGCSAPPSSIPLPGLPDTQILDGQPVFETLNPELPRFETEDGPDADADAKVVVPLACGVEGAACNDGDFCTNNDRCVADTCVGTPLTCDDENPCTVDSCAAGTCQSEWAPDTCFIEGACWTDGQPDPSESCRGCTVALSKTAWSPRIATCDDGDPCTDGDGCAAGLCTGKVKACPDDGDACTLESCAEGACVSIPALSGPCDDGDLCTFGDYCEKGACLPGTSTTCPDDGNPCTVPICIGGACTHQLKNGQLCDDGNACTSGETCIAGICQGGVPKDIDLDGSVDIGCGGGDCNDGVFEINPSATEQCDNGVDDNCDGATDANDLACHVANGPCAYQNDCWAADVCAVWPTTGAPTCSTACAGDTDCEVGHICRKVLGAAQVGFCGPPIPGAAMEGGACIEEVDCQSGICAEGVCRSFCLNEASCGVAGYHCQLVGDLSIGLISGACVPPFIGSTAMGINCFDDAAVCETGHCDLLAGYWTGFGTTVCAPLCARALDCPSGMECGVVIRASAPSASALVLSPEYPFAPTASMAGCFSSNTGFKPIGSACGEPKECLSGMCAGGSPNFCTGLCVRNSDCGGGLVCETRGLPLKNPWLVLSGTADESITSLARLCVPAD